MRPSNPKLRARTAVVIGAGVGGLAAALELGARGIDVLVLERASAPGGKMREVEVAGRRMDAGPTVLTLREVFEELFAAAGDSLEARVPLRPARILARHAWRDGSRLDLHADLLGSAEAIGTLAGAAEARRFLRFSARAAEIWATLERSFVAAPRTSALGLARRLAPSGFGALFRIRPFLDLWSALGEHFHNPRLRQLFGRYATYCGSSPFEAPATLMLIAHVERSGVWLPEGGMHRLAAALAALAVRHGARFRYGAEARAIEVSRGRAAAVTLADGERIAADAVIMNGDVAALVTGRLGPASARAVPDTRRAVRSLSALTWNLVAPASGFPLLRHNVFFSSDYAAEFDALFHRSRVPREPTVYVCAQDRGDCDEAERARAERLLCLINAPAVGDSTSFGPAEIERCERQTFGVLASCGLRLPRQEQASVVTTPSDFERLFPATGGALYGRATHGWRAAFARPGSRTRLAGLYLAGGSVHPGPGVPMAAISGRLAAASVIEDFVSIARSSRVAMPGGTSMR